MSLAQRLFMKLLPAGWAADMRASSESWKVRCPACGHERSVWEMGGIRWRAAGNPRWLRRCPACGKIGWHTVYHKPAGPAGLSQPPAGDDR